MYAFDLKPYSFIVNDRIINREQFINSSCHKGLVRDLVNDAVTLTVVPR